jgi:YD repeat-containing protein
VYYPQGLDVKHHYNARGYLAAIENVSTSLVYWEATAMNAEGQLTQATFGNGISTQWAYNAQTGLINALGSRTPLGANDIQDLGFTFDTIGNLTAREDYTQSLSETFVYDSLNRMTSSTLDDGTTQTAKQYTYDALGNILSKTGIGSYVYGENGAAKQLGQIPSSRSSEFFIKQTTGVRSCNNTWILLFIS